MAVTSRMRGAGAFVFALLLAACGAEHDAYESRFPAGAANPPTAEELAASMVLEKPASPLAYEVDGDAYACTECHEDQEPEEFQRRELTQEHVDIVLHHDERNRWCLDCHDAENRDMLRLANGALLDPKESHRLCGQCHGDKFRDWRAGVHGRRTGSWDGEKTYLLCIHCHDPHAPRFKAIKPLPAPRRPEDLR